MYVILCPFGDACGAHTKEKVRLRPRWLLFHFDDWMIVFTDGVIPNIENIHQSEEFQERIDTISPDIETGIKAFQCAA